MSDAASITLIDGVVGAVLAVAIVRGVFIGLIRETFSIAALCAAVLAARYGAAPGGAWLTEATGGETGPFPPEWMAGTGLAIGAALAVAAIGAFVRRGARWVGLSWADRAFGGALGAAEGIVVGMLIVLGTTFAIGRQHPVVQDSRSLAAYDALRDYVGRNTGDLPDVAAPAKNWP